MLDNASQGKKQGALIGGTLGVRGQGVIHLEDPSKSGVFLGNWKRGERRIVKGTEKLDERD